MTDIKMPVFNEHTTFYHMLGHRLRKAQILIDEAVEESSKNPSPEERAALQAVIEKLQVDIRHALTLIDEQHKGHAT